MIALVVSTGSGCGSASEDSPIDCNRLRVEDLVFLHSQCHPEGYDVDHAAALWLTVSRVCVLGSTSTLSDSFVRANKYA